MNAEENGLKKLLNKVTINEVQVDENEIRITVDNKEIVISSSSFLYVTVKDK
jgi:hypothetical protein